MLFDSISRDFKGPHGHTEPLFDYLNRSARPSVVRLRELLDGWFSKYPKESQAELRIRFRSSDDIHHRAAFFELYMHELLISLGFQVETHPTIPDTPTHPEFLVSKDGKPIFYIEATLAAGPSEETAADKRENVVYETIDRMHSPNFFIGVKVESSTTLAPPGRKWRTILEKWLSDLDPDAIGEKLKTGGLEDLPNIVLEHEGWKVSFQAIPKSPEARGKQGIRPIGLYFYPFQECKEDEWVRNAIKEKATKYGDLNLSFIIAINVLSIFSNDEHMVMDALYGDEQVTIYQLPTGGSDHRLTRALNGTFRGPKGPQNTRVSGIIICNDLLWGNIGKINPVLWHNPWAAYPIYPDIWPLPQWLPNAANTRIEPRVGTNIGIIFGLAEEWPNLDRENDLE